MSTDPIAHLLTLPEYPEGSRVAAGDDRFWAANFANGDKCVFVELETKSHDKIWAILLVALCSTLMPPD